MRLIVVHNKSKYSVEIDTSNTVVELKQRLAEITKVPVTNQNLFGAKCRFSTDEDTLEAGGVKDGMKLLLMGTEEAAAPVSSSDYPHIHPQPDEEESICMCDSEGNFLTCSYLQGHIKQDVFVCLECNKEGEIAGVCEGCARICHSGHKLLELYTKRNFKCDCGNTKMKKSCGFARLYQKDPLNSKNQYDHNFNGKYCKCNGTYDAENDKMVQCYCCDDWFHENHTDIPDATATLDSGEDQVFMCSACITKYPFLIQHGKCPITGRAAEHLWRHMGDVEPPHSRQQGGIVNQPVTPNVQTTTTTPTTTTTITLNTDSPIVGAVKRELPVDNEPTETEIEPPTKKLKTDASDYNTTTTTSEQQSNEGPNNNNSPDKSTPKECKAELKEASQQDEKEKKKLVQDVILSEDWRSALCKCKQCCEVYKSHNMQWLYIQELDTDKTATCVVFASNHKEEDGGGTSSEGESSDAQGVSSLFKIRGLTASQQLNIAHGISNLKTAMEEWFAEYPKDKVLTAKDVEKLAEKLKEKKPQPPP